MSMRKDKSYFQKLIIPGIVLSIIIIIVLFSFGSRMISDAKSQVTKDYQSDVYRFCQIYNKQFYVTDVIADLISKEIKNNEDILDESNLEYIKIAAKTKGINNIYIVKYDYSAIDSYGRHFDSLKEIPELKESIDRQDSVIRFTKDSIGNNKLYICKGIISENQLIGYLIVDYRPEFDENLLDSARFTAKKTFALITANGDVVETFGSDSQLCKKGDNIFQNATEFEFIDGSYNILKQSISDCRSGYQQIIYNGESKYLYYSPLENYKGNVVMLVDYADVERSFNDVSKSIREMLIYIGAAILLFFGIFAVMAIFNKTKYNIESVDLQNKADTDQLTDLYNKMATERMIKDYLEGEGKDSLSMLFVLDVDNFKKINDTMGHAFGDKVLSQLGHQIRAWFRVSDIVGRIGGDEFMIFVKDIKNPEVVKREGSRIMQFFEGFSVGEYTKYSPTASIGGAIYPTDADNFEALYKAADKAVYKSKKEGKNRVSFYGDLNKVDKTVENGKVED